jgi:hypothetical protein
VLQHTPATQLPVAHSSGAVHEELFDCLNVHWPPLQYAFEPQLASVTQLVGQLGFVPSHANGVHEGLPTFPVGSAVQVPVAHVPHAPHAVSQHTPPTQLPVPHWSTAVHVAPLALFGVHTPPLQNSVAMQPLSEAQLVGHVACAPLHTSGLHDGVPGWPSARVVQLPVEQSPQGPHALLQQTLETQKLLLHASLAPAGHACPLVPWAAQVPPWHHAPAPQFASTVHVEEHAPEVHTPGEQFVPVPWMHVPLPLHACGVAALLMQTLPHDVPKG